MGLAAYTEPDISKVISSTAPLTFTFDGRYGGVQDKPIYLRNDDAELWYDDIVVSIVNIDTPTGTQCKLLEQDTTPVLEQWRDIVEGASLSMAEGLGTSSIADVATFLPLWVWVKVPRGLHAQNIITLSLSISATEHLING